MIYFRQFAKFSLISAIFLLCSVGQAASVNPPEDSNTAYVKELFFEIAKSMKNISKNRGRFDRLLGYVKREGKGPARKVGSAAGGAIIAAPAVAAILTAIYFEVEMAELGEKIALMLCNPSNPTEKLFVELYGIDAGLRLATAGIEAVGFAGYGVGSLVNDRQKAAARQNIQDLARALPQKIQRLYHKDSLDGEMIRLLLTLKNLTPQQLAQVDAALVDLNGFENKVVKFDHIAVNRPADDRRLRRTLINRLFQKLQPGSEPIFKNETLEAQQVGTVLISYFIRKVNAAGAANIWNKLRYPEVHGLQFSEARHQYIATLDSASLNDEISNIPAKLTLGVFERQPDATGMEL